MTIPRPEHPRPQFVRDTWANLNGIWDFLFDFGNSGMDREFWKDEAFDGAMKDSRMPTSITVPFCPESRFPPRTSWECSPPCRFCRWP